MTVPFGKADVKRRGNHLTIVTYSRMLLVALQAATGVMVFGALLMLVAIYFVRRDGMHHPRLAAFRAEDEAYSAANQVKGD